MAKNNQRIDKNPMHRGIGSGPFNKQPVNYEVREIEPTTHDELERRAGSQRQARYGQAPAFCAPGGSRWLVDRQGLDLTATNIGIAFQCRIGSIQAESGTVDLLVLQDQAEILSGSTNKRLRIWLEKASGAYSIKAQVYNDTGGDGFSPAALSVATGVDSGTDVKVRLYSDGGLDDGASVTLDVGGNTSTDTLEVGDYALSDCVLHILPGEAAEGDFTSIDPVNLFAADISGATLDSSVSRSPSVTPVLQLNADSVAPITPATGAGRAIPYPAEPLIESGKLRCSGWSGCLRVPFRSVFNQFFKSSLKSVASRTFAFKLKVEPNFFCSNQDTTLVDFPGFVTIERVAATGKVKLTYSGQTFTTTNVELTLGSETSIWVGCDDSDLFVYDSSGNSDTATVTAEAPFLDYERVPDLIIAAPEDRSAAANFHGTIAEVKVFNYAATSDDGESAIFDLDLSGTEPRDKSKYRLPISPEPHKIVDKLPLLTPGPVADQDHAAVLGGEVFVGAGTVDSVADTYLVGKDGAFSNSVVSARFGNKVVSCEPGGTLAVTDTKINQTRPLGVPQIQAEVTTRTLGAGGLDGAYCYGARYVTGDGTYGPLRRFKPVKAFNNAGVLVGASAGSEENSQTELGESYGDTKTDVEGHFRLTTKTVVGPSYAAGFDTSSDFVPGDEKGITVETHLRFPDFTELEESIFDRGVKYTGAKETMWAWNEGGIQIDYMNDFTLQAAFRLDTGHTSSLANSLSQCIFAIGHNDSDPWTRAFMLYLYKDASGSNWSNGTYRMVAARDNDRRGNDYKYAVYDDSTFWEDNHDYNVCAVRKDDALIIYVHKYDTDGTLSDFQVFDTKATGAHSSVLDPTDFWAERQRHKKQATNLQVWSPAHREEGGSGSSNSEGIYRLSTDGQTTVTALVLGAMSNDTYFYHHRAWSTALSKSVIRYDSVKRRAAVAGEPLNRSIRSDVGYFDESPSESSKKFWDKAKGVYWEAFANNTPAGKERNPPKASFETFLSSNATTIHGVYITDTSNSTIEECEYQLYASSVGEGSIILSTSLESNVLTSKVWDTNNTSVRLLGNQFDPENFNWYTTPVVFNADSSNWQIDILEMAVNGKTIFDYPITGDTVAKATLDIYLGGFTGKSAKATHVGEFRVWNENRYDDYDEEYDYLAGRVNKSADTAKLQMYAQFRPADENSPVDQYMLDSGTLNDLAAIDVVWQKHDGGGGGWSASDTSDTEVIDGRDLGGEVENPPAAVEFPDAPYPHITAIEILRTGGIPVTDINDEEEVARALLAADNAPLRFLARIPIGTNSYIDVSKDETLGAEVNEGSGFAPSRVNGVFLWNNQLGVFREGILQMAEPGPFGWESFLSGNQVTVDNLGTSDITAAVAYAGSLAVFGRNWCTILNGTPAQNTPYYIGGAGAQSARSVIAYGGSLFALSDTNLWQISPPSGLSAPGSEDFGLPVQDLLPTNGRLAVSADKSSLYVIDEDTGECLRHHFPTGRWTIESRDAKSLGDTEGSFTVVHASGAYSTENTAFVADDVGASDTLVTTATLSSPTSTITKAGLTVSAGTRLLVIDSGGTAASTRVVSYSGSTLTVTTNSLNGLADGEADLYFGVGGEGIVIDTGWYANPAGEEMQVLKINTGVLSGTAWEFSMEGSPSPGSRSAASTLAYTAFGATTDEEAIGGSRGRWLRTRIRNRKPELSKLDRIELTKELEE